MFTTQILADYICAQRKTALSHDLRKASTRLMLDLICAAVPGSNMKSVRAMQTVVQDQYGTGHAHIWFTGAKSSLLGASLANSSASTILDIDDGYRPARGHPGGAVIPAALACGQAEGASADNILRAIIVGYEVALRIAANRVRHSSSGNWSGFGAIAAIAVLRNSTSEAIAHALSVCALQTPILKGVGGTHYAGLSGSDVKEGMPWGVATGINALLLAEKGFTGPLEILDQETHFNPEMVQKGLGEDREKIFDCYTKPYALCRHLHAPIDALCSIMDEQELKAKDIEKIEVKTYSGALALTNYTSPNSMIDVQFSIPFSLAIAAFMGKSALMPIDQNVLNKVEISALAERVKLVKDDAIEARFPAETPTQLIITTKDDQFQSKVLTPLGEPSETMTQQQMAEKFHAASRHTLNEEQRLKTLKAIEEFGEGEAQQLFSILGTSLL